MSENRKTAIWLIAAAFFAGGFGEGVYRYLTSNARGQLVAVAEDLRTMTRYRDQYKMLSDGTLEYIRAIGKCEWDGVDRRIKP